MAEQFTTSAFIPALPMAVYVAWMEGDIHTAMTGAKADSAPIVGRAFSAWDGYIAGINLELEPGRRIVQSWRTREFPEDAPDSRVTITLLPEGNGTRLTLMHQEIPDGQAEMYRQGWQDHYFRPMQEYFVGEGIAGAPADAGVTEVIRRVSQGEAGLPPEESVEVLDDSPDPESVTVGGLEAPISDVNAIGTYASAAGDKPREGHAQFEPVDDDQEDEALDTSETREEWWGHLKPPTETKRDNNKEEKIPDTEPELNRPDDLKTEGEKKPAVLSESAAGPRRKRKRARRKPIGAGKPIKKKAASLDQSGKRTNRKSRAAIGGATKKKPAKQSSVKSKKATKKKKATTRKKPAKKSPAKRKKTTGKATKKKSTGRKAGNATGKKPARKSSAKSKKATKKKAAGSPKHSAKPNLAKKRTAFRGKRGATTKKKVPTRKKPTKKVSAKPKKAATKKKPARKSSAKTKKKSAGRRAADTTKAKATRKKATTKRKPARKSTRGTTKKKSTSPKRAAARKKPQRKRKGAK